MGKKHKEKKHKKNYEVVEKYGTPYLISGIDWIKYGINKENNTMYIKFSDVYLLGIAKDMSEVASVIDLYKSNDEIPGRYLYRDDDKDVIAKYLVVEPIDFTDTQYHIGLGSIDEPFRVGSDPRIVYRYDEDEDTYVRIEIETADSKFIDILDHFTDVDEFNNISWQPVVNLSRQLFTLSLDKCNTNEPKIINEDNKSEIDDEDDIELSEDEVKQSLKEFIKDERNDLTINHKKIKTDEDVDNLSSEDLSFIKDSINDITEVHVDDFFMR